MHCTSGPRSVQAMIQVMPVHFFNPIALRKAKIVRYFGLSECNRVNNLSHAPCQCPAEKHNNIFFKQTGISCIMTGED